MDARDRFSPLTPDEMAAARTGASSTHDEGGSIVPTVPRDAPLPPRAHRKWGKPTACWTYYDAAGATLQIIHRFDSPGAGKQILPGTLWRDEKGLRWRWKAIPSPRPLYGLDKIAARPDAPVIVCEGEKAAEAAAKIFPDHVAVTSSNGARAARRADWSPLSRRRVTIWPDNDEDGLTYARDVASVLTTLGCEVSVINADALVAIDGGARGSDFEPIGWDAANALAEWADPEALQSAALSGAKPFAAPEAVGEEAKPPPDEENISVTMRGAATVSEIKAAAATLDKDDIEGAKRLIEAALAARANTIAADQIKEMDNVVSKLEFSRIVGVSPARVSQYLAEGRISGAAVIGVGRHAKIDVALAQEQLRDCLDSDQRIANGRARLAVARSPIEEDIKAERLRQLQHLNAKAAEEADARRGRYILAEDAKQELGRVAGRLVAAFEGALPELAAAIAASSAMSQRDALHALRRAWRAEPETLEAAQ